MFEYEFYTRWRKYPRGACRWRRILRLPSAPGRYDGRMYTPQAGIFALGTSSHAYLEFDMVDGGNGKQFASTLASIREPRTTTGGVNFVIGFRPELWREIAPEEIP